MLQAKSSCSWRHFGDKENALNPSRNHPEICQNTTAGLQSNQPILNTIYRALLVLNHIFQAL
jgi:hypothetical protein